MRKKPDNYDGDQVDWVIESHWADYLADLKAAPPSALRRDIEIYEKVCGSTPDATHCKRMLAAMKAELKTRPRPRCPHCGGEL